MRKEIPIVSLLLVFPVPVFCVGANWKNFRADANRMEKRIQELSAFGANREGGVSRVAFSDADVEGRKYIRSLMEKAGLKVRVDAAGNIIGHREGRNPDLPVILFGSHIDSVPRGGNYDGDVGVLGALECIEILNQQNFLTAHPLEVIVFSDEEGGLAGSRAVVGELSQEALQLKSHSGKTIGEGIRFIGGDPDNLQSAKRNPSEILAYLELHIEQGGILEAEKINMVFEKVKKSAEKIATDTGTTNSFAALDVTAIPAPTDQRLRKLIQEAATGLGLTTKLMPSGAGHDAQDLARIVPIGMIFVPSVGGISHSPKEFTTPPDVANGASVLMQAILEVDKKGL